MRPPLENAAATGQVPVDYMSGGTEFGEDVHFQCEYERRYVEDFDLKSQATTCEEGNIWTEPSSYYHCTESKETKKLNY